MFAIPFWASWLFVAGLVVWQRFGKELVQADQDGIYFERYALIRITQRSIPRKEILGFDKCKSFHTQNDEHLWGIEARTLEKPLRFLFDLPSNELIWLIDRLNQFFGTQSTYLDPKPKPISEVLDEHNSLAQMPCGCRWKLERDSRAIHFRRRSKTNWFSLLGSLFACIFWNGIVGLFVLVLLGLVPLDQQMGKGEWWGLFFFLIPFEIVGAGMLLSVLSNMLMPLHVTAWEVTRNSVTGCSSWAIASFRKTRKIDRLAWIEIRETEPKNSWFFGNQAATGDVFSLVMIDRNDSECCTIVGLTQGEARWMGHQILTYRSQWFEKGK